MFVHLLKIDNLQAFFKKETMQGRWNLPIGDEHRSRRQMESPSRDRQPLAGGTVSRRKAMFAIGSLISEHVQRAGDEIPRRQRADIELDGAHVLFVL